MSEESTKGTSGADNNKDYSAENIQVLEGLEAVRKRPAMFIGDVSEKLSSVFNESPGKIGEDNFVADEHSKRSFRQGEK